MRGVEDIEQDLQERSFDETSFSVIQIDGNKGCPGGDAPGEEGVGNQRLYRGCVSEKMDQEHQKRAMQAIVCFEQCSNNAYRGHRKEFPELGGYRLINMYQRKP